MSERVRAHVVVSGRVQGVFFRASAAQQAHDAGVDGWVRNTPDGRVEAVFEGERERVQQMVDWCRHGPEWASVDGVEVSWEEPEGHAGFRIR